MNSRLGIVLFLFVLIFDGVAQGQLNSSAGFLFSSLNPDGVAAIKQQRKKRRRRNSQRRAKIYRIKVGDEPGVVSPPSPEPVTQEEPTMAGPPPVQARPEMETPGRGAPRKRSSAPRIKPPTVQIKPPTR